MMRTNGIGRTLAGLLLVAGLAGCKQQLFLEPADYQSALQAGPMAQLETQPADPITTPSVPEAVLDAVRSDSRYGHDVRLIGGQQALYSDALGEPGSPGETYVGMVRHNIDTIVAGLGK